MYGSPSCSAHRVAATVTGPPRTVVTRTQEVSSDSMSLARSSSVSMPATSSARVLPASARAVATACARGLVSAPSTTSAPSSRRRPAQGARRKYASSRTQGGPADPRHPADGALGDQLADRGHGVRAERLEADLAGHLGRGDPVGHPAELGVRGRRRLLQQQVHAPLGRGEGEGVWVGMGVQITAARAPVESSSAPKSEDCAGSSPPNSSSVSGVSSQIPTSRARFCAWRRRMFSTCQRPWPRAPARTTGTGAGGVIPSPPPR